MTDFAAFLAMCRPPFVNMMRPEVPLQRSGVRSSSGLNKSAGLLHAFWPAKLESSEWGGTLGLAKREQSRTPDPKSGMCAIVRQLQSLAQSSQAFL